MRFRRVGRMTPAGLTLLQRGPERGWVRSVIAGLVNDTTGLCVACCDDGSRQRDRNQH
jgi:hypothetical protein